MNISTKLNKSSMPALVLALASASGFDPLYAQPPGGQAVHDKLPLNALKGLQKQESAMAKIHLEYGEIQAGADVPGYYGGPTTYSAHHDSNRFYLRTQYMERNPDGTGKARKRIHEDSYDGKYFYFGEPPPRPKDQTPAMLAKYQPDDMTDDYRRVTFIYFRYARAAGFYMPETVADVASFHGMESLVLRYLRESDSTHVEAAGQYLRITVHIPDALLMRARAQDLEKRRKYLERSTRNGPEYVAKEIEKLQKMQEMQPKRTVVFLLSPQYGHAVVERQEYSETGQRIVGIKSDKWKYYTAADIWLPGRCVENYYTGRFALTEFYDQPRLTVTFEMNRVEFGPPKNIPYALYYNVPGAVISDRTTPLARQRPDHMVLLTLDADRIPVQGRVPDLSSTSTRGHLLMFGLGLTGALLGFIAITRLAYRRRCSHRRAT